MKPEKLKKIAGYTLLIMGIIFIVVPVSLALWIFLSGAQIAQFVPIPAGGTEGLAVAFALFSNVCLVFFILAVVVWAGSIITSRGVTLIKDVKLKLVRKSLREAAEIAEKLEDEEA